MMVMHWGISYYLYITNNMHLKSAFAIHPLCSEKEYSAGE